MNRDVILLVDDSPDTLEMLSRQLEELKVSILTAGNVEDAVNILKNTTVDLVITDYKMPGLTGLDLVRHIKDNYEYTAIIMITGFASITGAVNAIQSGANEYLAKPFTQDELLLVVKKVMSKLKQRRNAHTDKPESFAGIIGKSKVMQQVFDTIRKASLSKANVLITGESGVGKELVARAIHYQSSNASSPFIAVNCAAIPQELMESEFFGYLKGAFTGAANTRKGFFQAAHGGSIFLDEVSEMILPMQAKLLRVIQDREVSMVGSYKTEKVDTRIIAATNKNLQAMVEKGLFREDLFYRLNVINIEIPPLVMHKEDIPLLVRYFVQKYASELGRGIPHISDRALEALEEYHYPGNIRELENFIQRAMVLNDRDTIDIGDLPEHLKYSLHIQDDYTRTLVQVEKDYIQKVLTICENNQSKASSILGIDRKTLYRKLKE
ncbi:MAG TPA: sigma-54 dependent transcriptional regulator [Candidatus Cloacimonadota bacterium]|nr:sigma-54 dependent transcriptional regulator [Candidatus Cloacimonadota bacterium]HPT72579.1 sigma-54 dependent transcriptional regulator [Candidatus Cloacimonadota bacterium]